MLLGASPALAAESAPSEESEGDSGLPLAGGDLTEIRLPTLVVPLTRDGKLLSYAYLDVTMNAESAGEADALRLKIPYFQDAFVREVHRSTVLQGDDTHSVDEAALTARLMTRAQALAGSARITKLSFIDTAAVARERANQPPVLSTKPASSASRH